jgi:hypothetical protein
LKHREEAYFFSGIQNSTRRFIKRLLIFHLRKKLTCFCKNLNGTSICNFVHCRLVYKLLFVLVLKSWWVFCVKVYIHCKYRYVCLCVSERKKCEWFVPNYCLWSIMWIFCVINPKNSANVSCFIAFSHFRGCWSSKLIILASMIWKWAILYKSMPLETKILQHVYRFWLFFSVTYSNLVYHKR